MNYDPEQVPYVADAVRTIVTTRLRIPDKPFLDGGDEMTWRGIGRAVLEALADTDAPEKSTSRDHDPVNHPAHYTSSPAKCSGCGKTIECIDVTRHQMSNVANVFKYLWRMDLKGAPIQDLEKAAVYLADEIARRKGAAS